MGEEERLMRGPAELRRLLLVALVIALIGGTMALVGCGSDEPSDSETSDAAMLWDEIRGHNGWDKAPGYRSMQPAEGPHGDQVLIFVNDDMAAALESTGETEWPVGSIVVKEFFEEGDIIGMVVMEKRDDGRFWGSYSPAGEVYDSGVDLAVCEDCHADGSDGVLAFSLP
jgi:hypothetical protein